MTCAVKLQKLLSFTLVLVILKYVVSLEKMLDTNLIGKVTFWLSLCLAFRLSPRLFFQGDLITTGD